jgi:outer membrane protein OmpA-like peptidoglycan-associated protein
MKKIKLTMLLALISIIISAQEKGSYISITLGGGNTGINYSLQGIDPGVRDGSNRHLLGGLGKIEYSYYFTRHLGISLGGGISYYRTSGIYSGVHEGMNNAINLGPQIDIDETGINNYDLLVRLFNWEERQECYLVDIPLMIRYQHKFGDRQKHGLYISVGAKAQIPIKTQYSIIDSKYSDINDSDNWRLNISGYYEEKGLELGDPFADSYVESSTGFGMHTSPGKDLGWKDEFGMLNSWTGTFEAGFLFGLSRRVDLTVGGYIDYGFNNLKKGAGKSLLEAPESYLPDAGGEVGYGIKYNGMLNSDKITSYHLMSYGGTVGLRIKLGKLHNPDPFDDEYHEQKTIERELEKKSASGIDPSTVSVDVKGVENALDRIENLMQEMVKNQQPDAELQAIKSQIWKIDTVYSTIFDDGLSTSERNVMTERIYFDYSKYNIREDDKLTLDKKAEILKSNPKLRLRILGNTCDLSGDRINIPLGLNRANSAKQYLIDKGIDAHRIVVATQASNDPVAPNNNEEHRKLNRRCDFEIVVF